MKHCKQGRKLSRNKKQREALLKIMLGDLLVKRKITTTLAKAKELKMIGEKIIGQLKKPGSLRLLKSKLPRQVTPAIIRDLAAVTASRKSGYLRVIKRERRRSDGAPLAIIEIIEDKPVAEKNKQ
jgi:large subunit ribosomal protein L17